MERLQAKFDKSEVKEQRKSLKDHFLIPCLKDGNIILSLGESHRNLYFHYIPFELKGMEPKFWREKVERSRDFWQKGKT